MNRWKATKTTKFIKTTLPLTLLYLLPWGIQCLVNNFMPVYLSSLPFATEKTVGYTVSLGAAVTMATQLAWAKAADQTGKKSGVLALSLLMLAVCSLPFLIGGMTEARLYLMIVLFYSCYMAHQPLIDTIAAENCQNTGLAFGRLRSFASLGYALCGLMFGLAAHRSANDFFVYVAGLAVVSALAAKGMPEQPRAYGPHTTQKSPPETRPPGKAILNRAFLHFLVYTFLLFLCSSMLSAFFPVYYSTDRGLNADIGALSLMVSAGTFVEWMIMVLFGRAAAGFKPKTAFLLIALSGVCRSLLIYLVQDWRFITLSVLFSGVWFGLLWATATPYLAKILPAEHLTAAQGLWTVVAFGISPFLGSFAGGQLAAFFGLRQLFLLIAIILAGLCVITPFLFPSKAEG